MQHRSLTAFLLLILTASTVSAEEVIFLRGKEDKGVKTTIRTETPAGITGTGGKDVFKADEIVDVHYDITPISIKTGAYKQAKDIEAASLKPDTGAGRKTLIDDAIKKYTETFAKMDVKDDAGKSAKRHLAYKIAMLHVREVMELGFPSENAIADLRKFASANPNSWQIIRVLEVLGKLQLGQKDYDGAEETYKKLAALDLPEEAKQEAQLMAVQVVIQAGKHGQAIKELQSLASKLPKESRFASRVKVAQAECQIADKKIPEAQKILRDVLKETTDSQIKAIAHNDLGMILYNKGEQKEALWEFLYVDVVFNQDKTEHSKALFHLWKIFSTINDAEHTQECRELLLSSAFNGLEYQNQLKREAKIP